VPEAVISLLLTALLLMGSPGPATLALAATGASVGFQQGLSFLAGILLGLAFVITSAGLGLAALFTQFAQLRIAFQIAGALYILYLAYRIATAPVLANGAEASSRLPGLRDGLLLNVLNVKAYAVFVAIFSGFVLPMQSPAAAYLITGLLCFSVGLTVNIGWLWFGGAIRPLFTNAHSALHLRRLFALLMVASVLIVLLGD
jgi:threonine/homoserine/homoserine lactone efflux protein